MSEKITNRGLGVGQTVQDVSGSRSFGTTYYNTSGKPIQLCLVQSGLNLTLTVGGNVVASGITALSGIIIPLDASYIVTSSGVLQKWVELR